MSETPYKFQAIPLHVHLTEDMLLDIARGWKLSILYNGHVPVAQEDMSLSLWINALTSQFNDILKAQLLVAIERMQNEYSRGTANPEGSRMAD